MESGSCTPLLGNELEQWASLGLHPETDFSIKQDNDIAGCEDPQLCRLCAKSTGPMLYIFGDTENAHRLAYKINTFLPIKVKVTDPLPKQVCMPCVSYLEMISEYAEYCMQAEEKLKSHFKAKLFRSRVNGDGDTSCRAEPSEGDGEGPQKDSCFSCPLCCTGNMSLQDDTCVQASDTEDSSGGETTVSYVAEEMDSSSVKRLIVPKRSTLSELDKSSCDVTESSANTDGKDNLAAQLIAPDVLSDSELTSLGTGNYCFDLLEDDDVEIPFLCPENGETYLSNHTFNREKENVRPSVAEPYKSCSSKENMACPVCGELFATEEQCQEHSCHMHACAACSMRFNSSEECSAHSKGHLQSESGAGIDKPFFCQGCDELFEPSTDSSTHTCSNKKPFKCNECSRLFASENRLIFHRNYSHGTVLINCVFCKEEITSASEYFSHMKTVHFETNVQFCQLCGKHFANISQFIVHVRTVHSDHYNVRPYTCKVCGKEFHNKQILQGHYVTHMDVKPFKCDFCGLALARKNSLRQHMLSHHAKSFPPQSCYQCNTCKEAFTNLNQAVAHTDAHALDGMQQESHEIQKMTVSQLYLCEFCESCYTVKSALIEHRQLHKGDNCYVCRTCNASFSTYGRASKHRLIHVRLDDDTNSSDDFTVSRLFVCEECDKCFPHWTSICHHRRNQHQSTSLYICKLCNETFKKFSEYQEHKRIHPAQIKLPPCPEGNLFKCDNCNKSFGQRSTLVLHQRIHTSRQPHVCKICGDMFRLKSVYEKHVSKHTGTKPYICDVCGKGFTQNSGLYTHRRVHTGEKPYPCDLCEKNFRLKHDRDNHRRCHTGERPYQCCYCGKAFRTSHDHRQHQLIHTGQRPYSCDYCGKGFRRINALNVHKRIHTGERPYGCDLCGRYFTQKGDMMKHRKTQHEYALITPNQL